MHTIYDILGCGFGPANLGIAVALVDKWGTEQSLHVKRAIFIEKYQEFQWHPGMLLPGTRMQISCLKDLATLRDPTSAFTFLSYLHAHNRLSEFINRGTTIPSRREFADYLGWAARGVSQKGVDVAYGEEVISVSKEVLDERQLLKVISRVLSTGEEVIRWTKHIIISPGGRPCFPPFITRLISAKEMKQAHIIHTSSYVNSIGPILSRLKATGTALRIAVLGGGQSAAECLIDIHRRLESSMIQGHHIDLIIQKSSLKPSDDSPFVNEIFDPKATDDWYYGSTEHSRLALLAENKNTNYGVVNPVTIDRLYELVYDQKLSESISNRHSAHAINSTRINIRSRCSVVHAALSSDSLEQGYHKITLTLHQKHTLQLSEETYDMIICGTGYHRNSWPDIIRSSNLADDYGLAHLPDDGIVKLVPDREPFAWSHDARRKPTLPSDNEFETESVASTSNGTSPSLSPRMEEPSSEEPEPTLVRISRRYQLIPRIPSPNRIYLQGCAEASHGISDTLLSIIAVRSGEVVDDIWEANE